MYSCHLYRAHLCMKCSLDISNFLKRSLVFPILLFSSISLHWSLKKAFLSLLAILWNSAFRCLYLSFSPLLFTCLLFTAIFKPSPDGHFAFLHFFFLGMVLIPVSYTVWWTSFHSSSGTVSVRSSALNLFLTSTVWIIRDYYLLLCVYYSSIKDYASFFFVFVALWHFWKGITCEIVNSVSTEINVIFRKIEHLFWNFLKWSILSLIPPSIFLSRNTLGL